MTNEKSEDMDGETREGPVRGLPEEQPLREGREGDRGRDTQCGVFSWRPVCLQPFATIWVFTATISAYNVFGGINQSYYSAVISQIEKRFGLSSAMTGFIKNIDNFGFMVSVIVVSHFCRYANKPRLFAIGAIVNAFAIFMFGLPHFLYDNPNATAPNDQWQTTVNINNQTLTSNLRYEVCDGLDWSEGGKDCEADSGRPSDFHAGAMALFVLSELLQGMAVAPKYTMSVTYMDDNAEDESSSHFGVMFGIRAVSPLFGYLLGWWTNSIYVDLSDPGIDQKDPRWVGAWWIGFVLCGLSTVLWAIPLVLFPSRMKGAPVAQTDDDNLLDKTKDLPKAVVRLAKNPVYMFVLIGGCFNMSMVGFSTFIPKYLEYHFGVTASIASIYTGVIAMFSWGVGPVISGCIMSKTHMRLSAGIKFTCLVQFVAIITYAFATLIKCPDSDWAGGFSLDQPEFMTDQSMTDGLCNSGCYCDPSFFNPVCGADNKNYYSACYAGCLGASAPSSQQIFENCSCVFPLLSAQNSSTPSLGLNASTASLGLCPKFCPSMYPYMILILISGFATSMVIVPVMTTLLKCVDEKDKAMGLAFSFALTQLLGFPAPILYGRVIDSACAVQQTSCSRQGACLYYDNDKFRVRYHLTTIALNVGAVVMYGLSWFYCRRREKRAAKTNSEQHNQEQNGHVTSGTVATTEQNIELKNGKANKNHINNNENV